MSTAVEILEFSRDLVKNSWTRDVFAEDNNGDEVGIESPYACSFCAMGAFKRATYVLRPTDEAEREASIALRKSMSSEFQHIVQFNDAQHSEEPVVDLFDRAIVSLKESA